MYLCRDMQVVIEKLQAGMQKAQAVACKLETSPPSADSEQALVWFQSICCCWMLNLLREQSRAVLQ